MVMMLEKEFNLSVYYWPKEEIWWDAYADGAYDLIVLDEFHSQKTITQLNPILSGDPTPLSRRCSAPLTKRDNLPVIIMSNYIPEECFSKVAANAPNKLQPLLDRVKVIVAEGPIRIVPDVAPFHTEIPDIVVPAPVEGYSPWMPSPDIQEFPGEFSSPGIEERSIEELHSEIMEEAEARFQLLNDPDFSGTMSRARLIRATDALYD